MENCMIIDDFEKLDRYVFESLSDQFDAWLVWRLKNLRDTIANMTVTPEDIEVVEACDTLLDHFQG
jgi:hypothetical protein